MTDASSLLPSFRGSDLAPIAEKVLSGTRLSFEDGVALFATRDFLGLGRLANHVREARHGDARKRSRAKEKERLRRDPEE